MNCDDFIKNEIENKKNDSDELTGTPKIKLILFEWRNMCAC